MKNPILSIVITNYNSGKYLSDCLTSLQTSTTKHPFEIIVVDNNSTDNSANLKTKDFDLNLRIVKNKQTRAFQSVTISVSDTPMLDPNIFISQPDTLVEKNTLDSMVNFFETKPKSTLPHVN